MRPQAASANLSEKSMVASRASGEMADALASGASALRGVRVQVPPRARAVVFGPPNRRIGISANSLGERLKQPEIGRVRLGQPHNLNLSSRKDTHA